MMDQYARRHDLGDTRVTFELEVGQTVLLVNPRIRSGKMKAKALGPYTVVGYTSASGTVVIIESLTGARKEVSVANVIPLRPGVRPV